MSQLIFAQAKNIRRKALKAYREHGDLGGLHFNSELGVAAYNSTIEKERQEFREILEIAKLLHEDYLSITGRTTSNWYFISIRPKPNTQFDDFYRLVHKFINRAFMIEYKLSFEQKSLTGDGEGFHVHIVCNTKHRSKGEILRDTTSTFCKLVEAQCIDIKPTRNPEDIIQNYLIDYKSDDDHKEKTKDADIIWRTKMNLKNIYSTEDPVPSVRVPGLCPSSPGTEQIIIDLN